VAVELLLRLNSNSRLAECRALSAEHRALFAQNRALLVEYRGFCVAVAGAAACARHFCGYIGALL